MSTHNFPKYIGFPGNDMCAVMLSRVSKDGVATYYRHGGSWDVNAIMVDGKVIGHEPIEGSCMEHAHGVEMIEVTKEQWLESNGGYASDKDSEDDTLSDTEDEIPF